MRWQPHEYQRRAVEHLLGHRSAALWLDMGLGKTSVTLYALSELLRLGKVERALIVAPLRVAQETWPREAAKWSYSSDLELTPLLGGAASRVRAAAKRSPIDLINYENLAWLVNHHGSAWPYDLVIFDEASKMKAHSAARFKAVRKVRPRCKGVWQLSGTPAPNGLLDLWAQLWLLDQGHRLGRSFFDYRSRFFESDYMGYNWTPKRGAEDLIHSQVSDLCLSMSAEDYLQLPDQILNTVYVDLPPSAAGAYKILWKESVLELGTQQVTAVTAAVLTNKALQAANGALYTDVEGTRTGFVTLHDAKLDALQDVIEEACGAPVLVGYTYQSDLARLKARFPKAESIGTPGAVDAWNAGKIPILLAHPASAGHGLNLQDGGNILVWYGLPWSLELYEQFNARLHRQGQAKPVFVHHLVARDTLDETVLTVLQGKASVQDALLDAVRIAA